MKGKNEVEEKRYYMLRFVFYSSFELCFGSFVVFTMLLLISLNQIQVYSMDFTCYEVVSFMMLVDGILSMVILNHLLKGLEDKGSIQGTSLTIC